MPSPNDRLMLLKTLLCSVTTRTVLPEVCIALTVLETLDESAVITSRLTLQPADQPVAERV